MRREGKRNNPPADPVLTLPELLADGLDVAFVGINPGLYSARRGHYFARPTNRFWPAFSRSRLSTRIRASLGRENLYPEDDERIQRLGFGFTDVVLRATANASVLMPVDYRDGVPLLLVSLSQRQPRVACFNGITAFRAVAKQALGRPEGKIELGLQPERLGPTYLFVAPSPSPADAHFRLADQVYWYDRLADFLVSVGSSLS